jgi:dsRNA-specific ribonuclease
MISKDGQPHERVFHMSVLDKNGEVLTIGEGKTKKKAEQEASRLALVHFDALE